MAGGVHEVLIGAQQLEVVGDAQLGDQGVDRAELHSRAPASVAQVGRGDVVVARRLNGGKRAKVAANLGLATLWQEALQKLMHNEPCRHDQV